MLSLLAVGCTPAMMPHVTNALLALAAGMPADMEEGEAELRARPCYRRVLVAVLPARHATATMSVDESGEAVALLPVVAREVRTACAPRDAGPH
jgi:hypothetical protein